MSDEFPSLGLPFHFKSHSEALRFGFDPFEQACSKLHELTYTVTYTTRILNLVEPSSTSIKAYNLGAPNSAPPRQIRPSQREHSLAPQLEAICGCIPRSLVHDRYKNHSL